MTEVHRISGGADQLAQLIKDIRNRVINLETRSTGSIFISDQIITADPITGVETYFGALPDGRFGVQQYVNDETPPPIPTAPVVVGDRAVFEVTWDGGTSTGEVQPPDYARTIVEMSDSGNALVWVEVNYLTSAGSIVVGNQPYGEERFFRLVSVDQNGNRSKASTPASAILVSFMQSTEMTEYIGTIEGEISTAATAASDAQAAAEEATTKAENAEKLAQAASSSATSMVKNGSFELDFESWTKEGTNGTISTTTAYEGVKSWEIDTAGSGIYQSPIPVKEGDILVYEMHYKTIAGFSGAGGLRLQTSTDGTTFTNAVNGQCVENTDWVTQSVEYTVPTNITHIRPRIAFAASSSMGVWVDSVKLTDVTNVRRLEKLARDAKDIADAASTKAEDAARDAGKALTAANGKNTSWHQGTEPAGTIHRVNDIWFNTADGNKIHIWNGTDWIASRDTGIAQALSDAYDAEQAAAQAAQDASSATGTANTASQTASAAAQTASEAVGTAGTAVETANSAVGKAEDAFTAANGKNKITPSFNAAPTVYEGTKGDMWWQKSTTSPYEIIRQSTWNGASWDVQTLGNNTISNLNASKINVGTLAAERIGADSITAEKMATGTITADSGIIASLDAAVITVGELEGARIKAGTLLADRLVVGTGDNLIPNPEFTSGSSLTNARIAGSTAGATWSSPDYIGWNRTTASSTIYSLKLGGLASDVLRPVMPIISNRKYKISWTVYADAITSTSTRATYKWLNRDGTITSSTGVSKPLTATGLTSYVDEVTAPDEATHLAFALEFVGHPGGGWLDFRQPVVQLMTDGTIITEDAITADHIQAGEITGDVLDMGYIKGQIITANMFEGDTFSGGTFQDATFQTSPLPTTGAKMSPDLGLVVYGADNTPVLSLPPTGNAMFKGAITVVGESSVPMNAVTDLKGKMDTLDTTYQIVDGWASDENVTLIDGSHIETGSISADKISLGSSQNYIPGGDGSTTEGWSGFVLHYHTGEAGWPSEAKNLWRLTDQVLGFSPRFIVAGLNTFNFSYTFVPYQANQQHRTAIYFYDKAGKLLGSTQIGTKGGGAQTFNTVSVNQKAPAGSYDAFLYVEHNWWEGAPATTGFTEFGNFKLSTGSEAHLTASGMTIYKDSVQTLRLNGTDNFVMGEFVTGNPATDPYIIIKNTEHVGGIDFYGDPDGVANHGAMWWNQGSLANATWGKLSLYAMDDSHPKGTGAYYASGIELNASGYSKFNGRLSREGSMLKSGEITFTGTFGPGGYGTFTYNYPTPFPSGTIPRVLLTSNAEAGAEVAVNIKSRSNTHFEYVLVNQSPRDTKEFSISWIAVRA